MQKTECKGWFISYRNCEFFLPFICRRCGRCCEAPVPRCVFYAIHEIGAFLGMSSEDVLEMRFSGIARKIVTDGREEIELLDAWQSSPCPFLSPSKDCCEVYTVRPEGCRLYPLNTDGGANDVRCPGYIEFYQVRSAFFKRRIHCSADTFPTNKRRPCKSEWPGIIRKLRQGNPSSKLIARFLATNNVPEEAARLAKKTK